MRRQKELVRSSGAALRSLRGASLAKAVRRGTGVKRELGRPLAKHQRCRSGSSLAQAGTRLVLPLFWSPSEGWYPHDVQPGVAVVRPPFSAWHASCG